MNPQYSEQPDGVQTVFAEPEENDAQSVFDTDEEDGVPDLYLLPMHEGNTDETEDSTTNPSASRQTDKFAPSPSSNPTSPPFTPGGLSQERCMCSLMRILFLSIALRGPRCWSTPYVPYKRYEPVEAEFNIIGWGRIILCRKAGLLRAECPEIGRWERWCRWSSDMYDEAYKDGTYVHPYLIHGSDSETDGSESGFDELKASHSRVLLSMPQFKIRKGNWEFELALVSYRSTTPTHLAIRACQSNRKSLQETRKPLLKYMEIAVTVEGQAYHPRAIVVADWHVALVAVNEKHVWIVLLPSDDQNVPGGECTFENSIEVRIPFALGQPGDKFSLRDHKASSLRNHLVELGPFGVQLGGGAGGLGDIDDVHPCCFGLPNTYSALVAAHSRYYESRKHLRGGHTPFDALRHGRALDARQGRELPKRRDSGLGISLEDDNVGNRSCLCEVVWRWFNGWQWELIASRLSNAG
ncbi:hypothetical protein DFH06DRAFT_1122948 [Mycena polygramma]|nr:hypothetical protein DFH06DRAFT_1122948 [Mycena polygramma]